MYLNVSKGQTAPASDLAKAFGEKTSVDEIILEILQKGELQVGDKERHAQLERVHHEVLDIVAGKLVDPISKRVYTIGMIEKALDQLSTQGAHKQEEVQGIDNGRIGEESQLVEAKNKVKEKSTWTGVVTTKSAKSQALDAMKALIAWQPIPVSRARMRLRVTCQMSILKQAARPPTKGTEGDAEDRKGTVKERIMSYIEEVESQDDIGGDWEVVGFVEPGAFKGLSDFVGGETKGKGRIEVLDMAVVHDGD